MEHQANSKVQRDEVSRRMTLKRSWLRAQVGFVLELV